MCHTYITYIHVFYTHHILNTCFQMKAKIWGAVRHRGIRWKHENIFSASQRWRSNCGPGNIFTMFIFIVIVGWSGGSIFFSPVQPLPKHCNPPVVSLTIKHLKGRSELCFQPSCSEKNLVWMGGHFSTACVLRKGSPRDSQSSVPPSNHSLLDFLSRSAC